MQTCVSSCVLLVDLDVFVCLYAWVCMYVNQDVCRCMPTCILNSDSKCVFDEQMYIFMYANR